MPDNTDENHTSKVISKEAMRLRNVAVSYLSRYASSVENLRRKLDRKLKNRNLPLSEDQLSRLVDETIHFCQQHGFVNDRAYAETKVAAGQRRGVSRRKMSATLEAKGVSGDTISTALAEVDDFASALRLAQRRRIGPWRTRPVDRAFEKDVAALSRAGFPVSIAMTVVRMPADDAESTLAEHWNM